MIHAISQSERTFYDTHLLVVPQYSTLAPVEISSDLIKWTTNPDGIRDTNTTDRARFYRLRQF